MLLLCIAPLFFLLCIGVYCHFDSITLPPSSVFKKFLVKTLSPEHALNVYLEPYENQLFELSTKSPQKAIILGDEMEKRYHSLYNQWYLESKKPKKKKDETVSKVNSSVYGKTNFMYCIPKHAHSLRFNITVLLAEFSEIILHYACRCKNIVVN